jgi:DNA processing protein
MRAADDERLARAALCRLAEPNDVRLFKYVRAVGAVVALAKITAGSAAVPRLADLQARLPETRPEADLACAAELGARFVVPGDLEWPSQLADAELPAADGQRATTPPLGLWVRGPGSLRLSVVKSVAIVGSRAATAYGARVASDFGSGLADRGWAVVSGGAYGIDAAAHRGVLAVGGATVAVLACGVDVAYPRGHDALLSRIAEEGLLVSELPPGSHPTKGRFLDRNRLIAALTRGTVLVEAAFRSGALNTGNWARRMGRPVLGVPGPVTSPLSAGVHRELVERRATLATSVGEVVSIAGTMGDALFEAELVAASQAQARASAQRPQDQLDTVAQRVLDALPVGRSISVLALSTAAGLSVELVSQRLGSLRLVGLVEEHPEGWRLATGVRPVAPDG